MKTKPILHFMLSAATMLLLTQCVTIDDSGYYPGGYNSGHYGHGQGGYGQGRSHRGHGYYDSRGHWIPTDPGPGYGRGGGSPMGWRPSTPYTPYTPYRY